VIEIRVPLSDEFDDLVKLDGRSFGYEPKAADTDVARAVMDLSRYRIAVDRGQIVGEAGSDAFAMTMPGGSTLPTAGVTWVSVAVTHRRQGLLRRLMDAVHDDIDARGEPLAALTASESGIYERFGYGAATRRRMTSIDRRAAAFEARFLPVAGSVRFLDGDRDALLDATLARWDRYRLTRAGEISRSRAWQNQILHHIGGSGVIAVHDDGYVTWSIEEDWNDGHARHTMLIRDFAASTPQAHAALWQTVLSSDLVGTIKSRVLPEDDPISWLLTNPRVVRTTDLNDGVWCRPQRLDACFAARRYGIVSSLVLDVDGERWKIEGGPDGAEVRRSRRRADLVTDRAGAGSLLLGGVSPTALVIGRRATARDRSTLLRADAFLRMEPAPHSTTGF
jgi:predicted acetyltransferase